MRGTIIQSVDSKQEKTYTSKNEMKGYHCWEEKLMQLADSHTSTQPLLPNNKSMLNAIYDMGKTWHMGKDAAFICPYLTEPVYYYSVVYVCNKYAV